ncbi:multicopper oxidase family protein [Martelella sp. HB161492]|uniref:multicopper oxidase family protein n=1 Tax=Martelella sp. HB161492 TaxID=2720726 RepID=UPI0015923872|nr:multicopper oxidase family protein [Martelella sp. HB161492]
MYRRQFLNRLMLGTAAACLPASAFAASIDNSGASPVPLSITDRTIEVNGRAARVYGLQRPGGAPGLVLNAGDLFNVTLSNQSAEPTLIHWHGLTPPWALDGVPDNPAPLLRPGEERRYTFPVGEGGTHWMHAHTLQEQSLLSAPLIVRKADEQGEDRQEVVMLLHDFSFKSPEELLAGLQSGGDGRQGMGGMHGMHGMSGMQMDINDIDFDAYLTNDRTLDDPEIIPVEKGGRVRLRIINAAAATAFTLDTIALRARLAAVDGREIAPVAGRYFPVSMGQRLDLLLDLPAGEGAYPVLALREGALEQTGLILATQGASVSRLSTKAETSGPVLDTAFEAGLSARQPLPQTDATRRFNLTLGGSMNGYQWSIVGGDGLNVSRGDRVQIAMRNMSMMGHPMHLHGHHFQVVGLNGRAINGAVRDTLHVPAMATVEIAFDAQNPGRWPFHCHQLYHMASGMMAYVNYDRVG